MKIEEGKYYSRADGSVHGPARLDHPNAHLPWQVGSSFYTGTGHYYADQAEHAFDLIAEAPSVEATPQEQFARAFAQALPDQTAAHDPVNHPSHYNSHPSGVECIVVTEHMNFCLGNAMKYIWRAGEKGDRIEDLKKARWYLDREIDRLSKSA